MRDVYFLEGFRIDLSRNRISEGSKHWQVEPKMMAVLTCLITAEGEVVTKETLLAKAWPDTVNNQDVLTRAISELRKIFGETPKNPRIIETIFKKGYRLMVTPQAAEAPEAEWQASAVSPEPFVQPDLAHSRRRPFFLQAGLAAGLLVAGVWLLSTVTSQPPPPAEWARPIPVTSLEGHEYRSPISPDGHRIAFIWGGEQPEESHQIYLKTIDEEGVHQFTEGDGFVDFPAWSPDGKYLAFTRGTAQGSDLLMKPVIGGQERHLLRIEGSFFGLDWSPDGKQLAYGASPTPTAPFQIFVLNLESFETQPVSFPETEIQGDSGPIWQRDGGGLAFIRSWNMGGEMDVFWIALDERGKPDGEAKQLTFDRLPIAGISWLPDNRGLMMITRKDGYSHLSQWSPGHSVVKSLPVSPGFLMDPYVGPAGIRVTFTQKHSEQNIWQKPLTGDDSQESRRVVFSTHADLSPVISPTGEHLAWISLRSGYREVWLADPQGRKPRQLSRFAGGHLESPKWTPDGSSVLVTFTKDGNSDICKVPVSGGTVTFLTNSPEKEALGFMSQDSQWLYFTTNREDGWQIWRQHLQTGAFERVTSHGGYAGALTAGGDLIYTKFGLRGIWKLPANGGSESLLVEQFLPRDYGLWLVHENQLYFLTWEHGHHELYRQDLTRGEREWVTRIGWVGWEPQGFTLSQDGTQLVFGQCDNFESDIMMVELAKR